MSIVPPAGGRSQGGSAWQRRVAAGTSRPIRWSRLDWQQQEAVKELFGRNRWRVVVDTIIANQNHYWETGEGREVHNYIHEIQDALGWNDDQWERLEEDHPDEVATLGWYHSKKD
jgi:hypothetical protein